jgi:hypothetical protein
MSSQEGLFDVETEISATASDQQDLETSYGVEFALVLARMIKAAREDPAQLRSTIYELARVKLRKETLRGNVAEEKRAMRTLEIAIQGVEAFSQREDALSSHHQPLPKPTVGQISQETNPSPPVLLIEQASQPTRSGPPGKAVGPKMFGPILRLGLVSTIVIGISALAFFKQHKPGQEKAEKPNVAVVGKGSPPESAAVSPSLPDAVPARGASEREASPPSLPTVYGIYALNNGQLHEIYSLPGQIPDKRVAISAPISSPSRTTLADGKVNFVVFRRDVATSAPDRVEVRVIAKITRAMTFDAAGKPAIASVGDTWSVRSIAYPFRVAPIPDNPEMLALKSEDPDFVLPAGRYAVVIKGQGYDFTVAGTVTDPSQCLEKVEAANGSFYAECRKP